MLDTIPQLISEYYREVEGRCSEARELISREYPGEAWCLPRLINEVDAASPLQETSSLPGHPLRSMHGTTRTDHHPLILSNFPNHVTYSDLTCSALHNPVGQTVTLTGPQALFLIPAFSTSIFTSIERGLSTFATAVRTILPQSNLTTQDGQFDLIILDPPWSNRSVRRSGHYTTEESQTTEPFIQSLPILRDYGAESCFVCVWITNKLSIRQRVMHSLQHLRYELHEEWIWLKVTSEGEPIYPLDGIWRRPYEILLLFKRKSSPAQIQRRIIVAVPDVHSRKPCLKRLLEPFLPSSYNALEVFARNLVAGWWSWGEEALKFQRQEHWVDMVE